MNFLHNPDLHGGLISKQVGRQLLRLFAAKGQEMRELLRYFGAGTLRASLNDVERFVVLETLKETLPRIDKSQDFALLLSTFGKVASSFVGGKLGTRQEFRDTAAEDILAMCARANGSFKPRALEDAGSDTLCSLVSSGVRRKEPLAGFLASALEGKSSLQKRIALKALAKFRYKDEALVQGAAFLLADADPNVRKRAEQALRAIPLPAHPLRTILLAKNPERPLRAYLKQKEHPHLPVLKELAIIGFLREMQNLSMLAEALVSRELITGDEIFSSLIPALRRNTSTRFPSTTIIERVAALQELILEKKLVLGPNGRAPTWKDAFKQRPPQAGPQKGSPRTRKKQ